MQKSILSGRVFDRESNVILFNSVANVCLREVKMKATILDRAASGFIGCSERKLQFWFWRLTVIEQTVID